MTMPLSGRLKVSNSPHRSFEKITEADIAILARIAYEDFEDLFTRKDYCRPYRDRVRQICLCQGAARHFVHGDRGVQDFDMWGFFAEIPDHPFPPRRRGKRDFGVSRFGRNPDDLPGFKGRRVDIIGRSIPMQATETSIESVQRYLRGGLTESARLLAERPVIVAWPEKDLGQIIWPTV
jgi:hypothetical protein